MDGLWAAFEVSVALLCSVLWVVVLVIAHMLDTTNVGFVDAVRATVTTHFAPTDALKYVTGILASSTAYTLFRLAGLRKHVYLVALLLLSPALLWFFATPLYMVPEPRNETFAGNLAVSLVAAALFVWWCALFTQRRVLERSPAGLGDREARELMQKVGPEG